MARFASVTLVLILLLGGLCSGLCFAQMPADAASHSCCHHGKDHCGHAGPSIDAHGAVAMVKIAPAILTQPAAMQMFADTAFETPAALPFLDSSPRFRSAVLRI